MLVWRNKVPTMTMMANNNYYGDNDENYEGNDQYSGIGFPPSDSGFVLLWVDMWLQKIKRIWICAKKAPKNGLGQCVGLNFGWTHMWI